MSRMVKVQDIDRTVMQVDCKEFPHIDTYGKLLKHLASSTLSCPSDDYCLVDAKEKELKEYEKLKYFDQQGIISLRYRKIELKVQDSATIETLQVDLATNPTVLDLKEMHEGRGSKKLENLSFHGQKLDDGDSLRGRELKDGDLFVGRLCVIIEDNDCDLDHQIENVYDYETIMDILKKYKEKSRRVFPLETAVVQYSNTKLDLKSRLYDCKIEEKATLEFNNPPYTVVLREKGQKEKPVEIVVQDHFTVQSLKEAYSKQVNKGDCLLEGDKLTFKDDYLDEKKELYKCAIMPRSEIFIEREDVTQVHVKYICADCGSEVRLKKNDAIQCRECSHRIVFKKRTTTPCQYLAR